jgi:hypothetical protein
MQADNTLKAGMATGTVLGIIPSLLSEDIARTILLAAIGATASFIVTLFLKWLFRSGKS